MTSIINFVPSLHKSRQQLIIFLLINTCYRKDNYTYLSALHYCTFIWVIFHWIIFQKPLPRRDRIDHAIVFLLLLFETCYNHSFYNIWTHTLRLTSFIYYILILYNFISRLCLVSRNILRYIITVSWNRNFTEPVHTKLPSIKAVC